MAVDANPSGVREFFGEVSHGDVSLVTINRTHPKPVQELLADAFSTQSVDLVERSLPDDVDDIVALRRDGEVSAVSSLRELMQSFLLVKVVFR